MRTWFVVEGWDSNLSDIRRISVHGELLTALEEALHIYERLNTIEDHPSYASVWGIYARSAKEAYTAGAYIRIWSSAEDPLPKLPKA